MSQTTLVVNSPLSVESIFKLTIVSNVIKNGDKNGDKNAIEIYYWELSCGI